MKIKILAYAIAMSAVALFFQNCGKVGFHTAGATALTTTNANNPSGTNITNGNLTNSPDIPPGNNPPNNNITTGDDSDTNVTPDHSGCSNHEQAGDDADTNINADVDHHDDDVNFEHDGEDSSDSSQYVECDLGSPNQLIVLTNNSLTSGSNASLTRVCMSKEACLQTINAYAQARNCSLTGSAAGTPTTTQCTAIFPGSAGTCHNAQILSDDAVSSLLATGQVQ